MHEKPKIIAVDDNKIALDLLLRRLTKKGYQAIGVSKAQEVLLTLKEHHPQLVILDLFMPDIDGFDIARSIRAEPELASIAILAYSAGMEEDLAKGLEAGCDDVCLKDGNLENLDNTIRKLLTKD